MYLTFNTGCMRSNMAFHEDWATTRAVSALKAFMTLKSMISDKKLVYDDRISISDQDDSEDSVVCYMQKKP